MANTPFELYEKAYRLHYGEKKIAAAAKIYKAIVHDFPDSNECGYAFIQLQKIKANAIGGRLTLHAEGPTPILLLACAASILALIVAVAGTLGVFHELGQQRQRTALVVAVLAKVYSGNEREARAIVNEIKSSGQDAELARELSSLVIEKRSLPARESPAIEPKIDSGTPAAGEAGVAPPAFDTTPKEKIHARAAGVATRRAIRGVHPAETVKTSPVVHPDSPSYF